MVMAYIQTAEDRLLMKPFRVYKGQKIDIRWSGGWLTPEGEYYSVDYQNGITHETIAEEHGSKIWGSGSIMTRPPVMRIFDVAKWMRITYMEGSSFCVEMKGTLIDNYGHVPGLSKDDLYSYNRRRQAQLLRFVGNYKDGFEEYYLNEIKFTKYAKFVSDLRKDNIVPTGDKLRKSFLILKNYF